MTTLDKTWDRIHAWLKGHCPLVLKSLGPPATEQQFKAAERAMGVKLPEEVKDCYRVHDGQRIIPTPVSYWPDLRCVPRFLYAEKWLGLDDVVKQWQMMKQLLDGGTFDELSGSPRGQVRADWWHPKWVPLHKDDSGYMHCLDLAPKSRGHVGQVIFWCHDSPLRGVLAKSLPEYLGLFAFRLETGEYVAAPERHGPGLIRACDA